MRLWCVCAFVCPVDAVLPFFSSNFILFFFFSFFSRHTRVFSSHCRVIYAYRWSVSYVSVTRIFSFRFHIGLLVVFRLPPHTRTTHAPPWYLNAHAKRQTCTTDCRGSSSSSRTNYLFYYLYPLLLAVAATRAPSYVCMFSVDFSFLFVFLLTSSW